MITNTGIQEAFRILGESAIKAVREYLSQSAFHKRQQAGLVGQYVCWKNEDGDSMNEGVIQEIWTHEHEMFAAIRETEGFVHEVRVNQLYIHGE